MGLKKKTKLRTSFIKFVIAIGISAIVLIVLNIILLYQSLKVVYPSNYSEKVIQENMDLLKKVEKVSPDLLTPMSSFGVYNEDGNYLYGNFSEKEIDRNWNKYKDGRRNVGLKNFIVGIKREEGILLIQYPITPQYKNKKLRAFFPNIESMIIILFCVEFIAIIFLLSNRFAKKINQGLNSLLISTKKIEDGDLNFNVGGSNIKEISMVLRGIEKMKDSLKSALEEQWLLEKQKRDQISALAHDVRTPLTIVKGNVELLKETKITQEQESYCNYIEDSSRQMGKYIESLLVVTRDKSKYNSLNENILIVDFLNSLKEQGESLCKTKKINLIWKMEMEKDRYILGYKDGLERALMNIISNAVNFSPKNSTIEISSTTDKRDLIIKIIDEGHGFSQNMLKHGKEQFAMEDKSRTKNEQHGLGLYIADNIIKKHNGEIILSNGINRGGFVTVKIPIEK